MTTPEPTKVDAFSLPSTTEEDPEIRRMIEEGGRDIAPDADQIVPIAQPRAAILQTQSRTGMAQPVTKSTTSRRGSIQGFDPFRTDDPDDEGKGID